MRILLVRNSSCGYRQYVRSSADPTGIVLGMNIVSKHQPRLIKRRIADVSVEAGKP